MEQQNDSQVSQPIATITPHTGRIIAISYRDKEVMREGVVIEQRPTMALIIDGGKTKEVALPTEDHEMCFMLSRDLVLPPFKEGGKETKISFANIGLKYGDTILMVNGGSASFFAFSLSNRLEDLGSGGVYWIGTALFKRLCDEYKFDRSKLKQIDDEGRRSEITFDHYALEKLFAVSPSSFNRVASRERDLILLSEVVNRRQEAMDARMACAHRVRQRMKKAVYCVQGAYPEGGVKLFIEHSVANDSMLNLYMKEEAQIGAELKKLLHSLPVWKVFEPIYGVGEFTAAPLIAAIGNIQRFPSSSNLKAYLGVHTLKLDGTKFKKGERPEVGNSMFARRRKGQLSNWSDARQALYLIADQFMIYRKNSPWGMVATEAKRRFQARCPIPEVWVKDDDGKVIERVQLLEGRCERIQSGWKVTDEHGVTRVIKGVTKYNKSHINRMAAWRTLTKFIEWLYRAWKATEDGRPLPALPYITSANAQVDASQERKAA